MSTATGIRQPEIVSGHRLGSGALLIDQVRYATREQWRSRIVLVFTFMLPLVWLLLIGIVAGNTILDPESGLRMMQFVTPTAAVMGILFATYPTLAHSLARAREQKILKRLAGTPLPGWVYLSGRTGAAVALGLASVAVMLAVGIVAFQVQIIWRTMPATVVTVMAGIVCLSMLGLAVGALASTASFAQTFAMGSAVAVTFLSGMFMIGSEPPAWLEAIAGIFPVQHLATALQQQFDPFQTGSGWDVGALLVMGAWAAGGLLVAVWALRREPSTRSVATAPAAAAGKQAPVRATVAAPAGQPGRVGLVLDQARWATRASRRDAGVVAFAVGMPVALYALMSMMYGDSDLRPDGKPFAFFFACGMAVYGIAVTAFINNPEFIATAREQLVLKRLRGTPLAPWQFLAGRTTSTIWIGALTAALVFAVGIAFFGVGVSGIAGLLLGLAVLLYGTLTLAACGYALVALAPSSRAVATVGLGILLPLCFVSDVFALGATPDWMATVGWLFPVKHFLYALAGALDPAGPAVGWSNLAVMAVWLLAMTLVAVRRFRWEPSR